MITGSDCITIDDNKNDLSTFTCSVVWYNVVSICIIYLFYFHLSEVVHIYFFGQYSSAQMVEKIRIRNEELSFNMQRYDCIINYLFIQNLKK